MLKRVMAIIAAIVGLAIVGDVQPANAASKPNILFVIMDDIGVDQLELFRVEYEFEYLSRFWLEFVTECQALAMR